ncbi:MAG: metalloregulator ArsR/SmtB family transcription factor [SAR324 cluster bacterium]|jgi:ArsR family transcriptional regulator|nr:metalloregulator ArsR/SmtB family transcription factor [SAR324 cluster bacterium]|tara:strand:- start:1467 stop:1808 length:342 start_codon:yes stop_codon:yes gene_type:complete
MENSISKNETLKCELDLLFGEQDENIETAAQCLKVLSHPARLRILCALRGGEQTVQNLEYYTGIRQTTLSQHLSLLKSRGLLVSRREATYSFYRISNENIIELFDLIKEIYCT